MTELREKLAKPFLVTSEGIAKHALTLSCPWRTDVFLRACKGAVSFLVNPLTLEDSRRLTSPLGRCELKKTTFEVLKLNPFAGS